MIQFLSPAGERQADRSAKRRRSGPGQLTIGIIDNGTDLAVSGLLSTFLSRGFPDAKLRLWRKPHGSAPSPAKLIDEVALECDAAVVGVAF